MPKNDLKLKIHDPFKQFEPDLPKPAEERNERDIIQSFARGTIRHNVEVTGNLLSANAKTIAVYKKTDETVNNTTTLQNDDELFFNINRNEAWLFQGFILHNTGSTPDLKITFTVPSGATGGFDPLNVGSSALTSFSSTISFGGTGSDSISYLTGIVKNGDTAGTVQMQWAQNTADASDSTILSGSCIIATRLNKRGVV